MSAPSTSSTVWLTKAVDIAVSSRRVTIVDAVWRLFVVVYVVTIDADMQDQL